MATSKQTDESVSVDQKRAEYEQFSFRVPKPGIVNVANHSYGDEQASEHCYSVRIDANGAVSCSCPHYQHRSPIGGCKHMLACEDQPAIMATAPAVDTDEQTDVCPAGHGFCPGKEPESSLDRTLQCPECSD